MAVAPYIISSGLLLFLLVCFIGVLVVKRAAGERRFLAWTAGIGAVLLTAFLVVYFFDTARLGSQRWAYWKYLDAAWSQYAVFGAGVAAALGAGTLALLVTPQEREGLVLRRVGAFLGTLVLVSVLLFVVFGVPVPGRF